MVEKKFINYFLTNPGESLKDRSIVYYFYQFFKQKSLSEDSG